MEEHCPNCGKRGRPNYSDNGADFSEWDCIDTDCRVMLYRMSENGEGSDQ